jgi:hypothetical protein
MPRTGRPKGSGLKLTPELHAALVEDRKGPLPDGDVALKNGVSARVVKNWIVLGLKEDAKEPYLSFAADWTRAKIGKKEALLKVVEDAGREFDATNFKQRGDYKSAQWQLKTMWPKHYGDKVQERGEQEGDIDIEQIITEMEGEASDLDALLLAPPAPLLEALKRNADAVRMLLDEIAPVKQLEAASVTEPRPAT